jgi:glucose/arabinose dehydrogenase
MSFLLHRGRPHQLWTLAVVLLAVSLSPMTRPSGRPAAQSSQMTFEGFRNVRTNGDDSTYGQGLTHRYVDGDLRFLTIAHPGTLHEFRVSDTALGGTITQTTNRWNLAPTRALNNFNAIWFEQSKNRLWLTSAQDYTDVNHPAKITLITLGTNGVATATKTFYLDVPAKRVYGGCNAVPAALVSQLGGPYVCGWGGYTSLVNQGGGASIGPTMYAIADPDTVSNGGTLPARTILDAFGSRGVRRTIPINYFDGGDPRQNPGSRPTAPPVSTAQWLSPNSEGLGWMVWGDSYYNTGVWIGTTYAAVASLCKGACWYQSSTLAFDGRQFELHTWDRSALGGNALARPTSMTELTLPRGNQRVWSGNVPVGNIAGATYDATSGRLYLIGFPFGPDDYTGRLFSYIVDGAGGGTPGPSPPVDAVVSEWSAWTPVGEWSVCSGGVQTRTEQRTRSVLTPPSNGGATPALVEQRMVSQACTGTGAPRRLRSRPIASGFDRPVGLVQHPAEPRVQLVIEQGGRVRVMRDGQVSATNFADLSGQVTAGDERGLLGLAFAPDFATSRRVFVNFVNRSGDTVIARFTTVASDPLRLDPASRFDLVWPDGNAFIGQPFTNHKGGHLAFGPDGYLYIGMGDGGSSNDPFRHAQQPLSLLGKMLRIDVSVPAADPRGYRIPDSNPFVSTAGVRTEIWALGLRNPWRWSFDPPAGGGSGALLIADVGQDEREELNYEPAGAGGRNYGWPYREGRQVNLPGTPVLSPALRDPIWEYGREAGRAVIGGYVYRGTNLGPTYNGRYFFADYATNRVWSIAIVTDASSGEASAGAQVDHSADLGAAAQSPVSFGVDASGELYVVSLAGSVYRIERAEDGYRGGTGPVTGTARPR